MNAEQIQALLNRLGKLSEEANSDRDEEYLDAFATGERADIFDWDVEIALNDLDALLDLAQAALAAMAENEALQDALLWTSGSADFADGGQAREGWLKLCAPLLSGGPLGPRPGEELAFAREAAKVDAEVIQALQARVKALEAGLEAIIDEYDLDLFGRDYPSIKAARALLKGSPDA